MTRNPRFEVFLPLRHPLGIRSQHGFQVLLIYKAVNAIGDLLEAGR